MCDMEQNNPGYCPMPIIFTLRLTYFLSAQKPQFNRSFRPAEVLFYTYRVGQIHMNTRKWLQAMPETFLAILG